MYYRKIKSFRIPTTKLFLEKKKKVMKCKDANLGMEYLTFRLRTWKFKIKFYIYTRAWRADFGPLGEVVERFSGHLTIFWRVYTDPPKNLVSG